MQISCAVFLLVLVFFSFFSPNWPTGPIRSSSRDVRVTEVTHKFIQSNIFRNALAAKNIYQINGNWQSSTTGAEIFVTRKDNKIILLILIIGHQSKVSISNCWVNLTN